MMTKLRYGLLFVLLLSGAFGADNDACNFEEGATCDFTLNAEFYGRASFNFSATCPPRYSVHLNLPLQLEKVNFALHENGDLSEGGNLGPLLKDFGKEVVVVLDTTFSVTYPPVPTDGSDPNPQFLEGSGELSPFQTSFSISGKALEYTMYRAVQDGGHVIFATGRCVVQAHSIPANNTGGVCKGSSSSPTYWLWEDKGETTIVPKNLKPFPGGLSQHLGQVLRDENNTTICVVGEVPLCNPALCPDGKVCFTGNPVDRCVSNDGSVEATQDPSKTDSTSAEPTTSSTETFTESAESSTESTESSTESTESSTEETKENESTESENLPSKTSAESTSEDVSSTSSEAESSSSSNTVTSLSNEVGEGKQSGSNTVVLAGIVIVTVMIGAVAWFKKDALVRWLGTRGENGVASNSATIPLRAVPPRELEEAKFEWSDDTERDEE